MVLIACGYYAQAQDIAGRNNSANENNKGSNSVNPEIFNTDLYTGTTTVNIPIHSYSIDNSTFDVSLSYNTQGIKVDQVASSVGLGWTLNAESFITRETHGIEDEMILPLLTVNGSTAEEVRGNFVQYEQSSTVFSEYGNYPDKFTVSLNGRVFDFGFKSLSGLPATPSISPNTGISVQLFLNGINTNNTLQSKNAVNSTDRYKRDLTFVITDESNNAYYFEIGDWEYATYQPDTAKPARNYRSVQRWVLTKVKTYSGAEIKYTYARREITYDAYKSQRVREISGSNCAADELTVEENKTVQWHGETAHVSKIEYPDGTTVSFDFETGFERCDLPGAFKVKAVTVEKKIDNNLSNKISYVFNNAYFGPACTPQNPDIPYDNVLPADLYASCGAASASDLALKVRLKLNSIDKVGNDGTTKERYYTFKYDMSQNVTPRLSPNKDHYGFYNASIDAGPNPWRADLAGLSIPRHEVSINGTTYIYGIDKKSYGVTAWVLTQVINASGGEMNMTYTYHTLSNPPNCYDASHTSAYIPSENVPDGDEATDGLCIEKIAYKDGYNADNSYYTTYSFTNGERFTRAFTWTPLKVSSAFPFYFTGKVYYNNFVTPFNLINGANHGYSNVRVNKYNYNNTLLGSTEYTFSNTQNSFSNPLHFGLLDPMHHTFGINLAKNLLGRPLKEKQFDYNNVLTSEVTNEYAPIQDYNNMSVRNHFQMTDCAGNLSYTDPSEGYFPITFGKTLLNKTTSVRYENGKVFQEVKEYSYDNKDNPAYVKFKDSKGAIYKTHTHRVYNDDVLKVAYPGLQLALTTQTWKYIGSTDSVLISYDSVKIAGAANSIRFPISYKLFNDHPLTPAEFQNAPPSVVQSATVYDSRNNVCEQWNEQGKVYSSAIWDTRSGEKLANVSNARYTDIAYSSFEGMGMTNEQKGNWDFKSSQVIYLPPGGTQAITGKYCYQIDGDGITSANDLTADKKYLLTFWAGGTPTITGVTILTPPTIVQQAGYWYCYSAEVSGQDARLHLSGNNILIDELRLYPGNASMSTTTYEPLFGPSSKCDAINNINYYEYDAMGRQTVVRDINRKVLSVTRQVVQGADTY